MRVYHKTIHVSRVDILPASHYIRANGGDRTHTKMISEERLYRSIGSKLRELREASGYGAARLTQAELAKQVGLERTSITNIEKGTQKVPLHVVYRLSEVFSVEPSTFLPSLEQVLREDRGTPALEQIDFGKSIHTMLPGMADALRDVVGQTKPS